MESGKAAGPSRVVSEMVIAGGEECMKVIADLINSIIRDGKLPERLGGEPYCQSL